ncbi:Acyl-CoA N-acyltransferase with RING/FYVE/PHD-type zinc finger protein [Euphorbia peplus]|nr:Acyl-CoA N-acyltransferase with RING/FYVE/PHD-type zinc finger protein [Euphorbia peplus]
MAYELRERKNNGVFENNHLSDDEEGSQNGETDALSDPDYTSSGPRRSIRGRGSNQGEEPRMLRRKLASSSNECSTSSSSENEDKTVLSFLINQGEISENERLNCEIRGVKKQGKARKEGVLCECCNTLMTVSKFEFHARGVTERPYEKIFTIRSNTSLLKHLLNLLNKEERTGRSQYNKVVPKPGAEDDKDDTCQVCADGGDLLCCEKCPSTFHLTCTEMMVVPKEKWYCSHCKCKYCGDRSNSQDNFACLQCFKTTHLQCYRTREVVDLNEDSFGLYCSSTCKEVAAKLRSMIGVKNPIRKGYSWSLIRRMEAYELEDDHKRMVINSKIALAVEVLNESFMTNIDRHTGINILESVVNTRGSNFPRMDFDGFYTLILQKKEAIISATTLRMHGNELAEMPFITTRKKYRMKGMSRMTFKAITYVLGCIGIKHLIIPAIEEVAEMWQTKYGFVPVDDEMMKKVQNYNTLMFPGAIRLQKTLSGNSAGMEIDRDAVADNSSRLAIHLNSSNGH